MLINGKIPPDSFERLQIVSFSIIGLRHCKVIFLLVSILGSAISVLFFPQGEFSGEESSRTGEWDIVEQWRQIQAEAGEHSAGAQVQAVLLWTFHPSLITPAPQQTHNKVSSCVVVVSGSTSWRSSWRTRRLERSKMWKRVSSDTERPTARWRETRTRRLSCWAAGEKHSSTNVCLLFFSSNNRWGPRGAT